MTKNTFLIFTMLVLTFGCKNSDFLTKKTDSEFTVQSTISDGGNYNIVTQVEQKKLTDTLFEIIASNLNIEKKQVMTFDLFENSTNYIWHAQNNQTGLFYRFISDKKFKTINYSEIKTLEIKSELTILNN